MTSQLVMIWLMIYLHITNQILKVLLEKASFSSCQEGLEIILFCLHLLFTVMFFRKTRLAHSTKITIFTQLVKEPLYHLNQCSACFTQQTDSCSFVFYLQTQAFIQYTKSMKTLFLFLKFCIYYINGADNSERLL